MKRYIFPFAAVLFLAIQPAQAADYAVDCAAGGNLAATVNSIVDKTAANRVMVTGPCNLTNTLNIQDFTNLTIQGPPGSTAEIRIPPVACGTANAAAVVTLTASRNITLRELVITGGNGIQMQDSSLNAHTLTVQQSRSDGIGVGFGSSLSLNTPRILDMGEPVPGSGDARKNVIKDNCGNGISVGVGSNANIGNHAEITNNGGNGVMAGGGFVNLNACCDNDGDTSPGLIVISGNNFGVAANAGGSLNLNGGQAEIRIEDNKHWGVETFNTSTTGMSGNVIVRENFSAPVLPFALLYPGGVFAHNGAVLNVNPGVQVLNNPGAGIRGHLQAVIRVGGPPAIGFPAPTGPTIAANTAGGLVLTGMSIAESFLGFSSTGNTGSDASCDTSSRIIGDLTGITNLKCANAEQPKK